MCRLNVSTDDIAEIHIGDSVIKIYQKKIIK